MSKCKKTKEIYFYLNLLDRQVKMPDENPSIGIILCADSSLPIFQYNSIVALVILRATWILELMISANRIVSLSTGLKDV